MRLSRICCLALVGLSGCVSTPFNEFGPYPSSSIAGGSLTAGVAGFVPGTVPQEGEFLLLVVNTDSSSTQRVIVSPEGALAITRDIAPCSIGNFAVSCDAPTVLIQVVVPGSATMPELTLTPAGCTQRIVYIGVEAQTDTGGTTDQPATETPPTLTETVPASAVDCGFGNLPDTSNVTGDTSNLGGFGS